MPLLLSLEIDQLKAYGRAFGNLIGTVLDALNIAPWEIRLEKNLQESCKQHGFNRSVFDIQQWDPPALAYAFYEQEFVIMHRNLHMLLEPEIGFSSIGRPSFLKTLQFISLIHIEPHNNGSHEAKRIDVKFQLNFLTIAPAICNIAFFTNGSCRWLERPPFIGGALPALTSVSSMATTGQNSSPLEELSAEDISTLYANCPIELQNAWRELTSTQVITSLYISQKLQPIQQNLITTYSYHPDNPALKNFCHPVIPSEERIKTMCLVVAQAIKQEHTTLFLAQVARKRENRSPAEELTLERIQDLQARCPLNLKQVWNKLTTSSQPVAVDMLQPIQRELTTAFRQHTMAADLIKFCHPEPPSVRRIETMIALVFKAIEQEQKLFPTVRTIPKPQLSIIKRTPTNQILFDNCLPKLKALWTHVLKHPETSFKKVQKSLRAIQDALIDSIDNKALDPQDAITFCLPDIPSRRNIQGKIQLIHTVIREEHEFLFNTNQRIE